MEEKQLDFNQPLLSVRRFSPKAASETEKKSRNRSNSSIRLPPLPAYKSDLKSGPVSHPGAVPFTWEQTPGRPKNEGKLPKLDIEQPPLTPNLPPGRASVEHQASGQVSKGSAISKSATKLKILREALQETDSSDSDNGDEAYQDAIDKLSTTESFLMNCSASGLSGLDDQETQPFGSFSSDQQARNFMIGRFLPAAKAIASGSPQYASRKPPVEQEEPRQVKEVVLLSRQRYSPLRQIVLSQHAQDIGEGESEDEDDNESDGSETNATKVCGLFPRLCFLNPLPELRMEGRVLSSAAYGMPAKSSTTHNGARKEHARTSHRENKSVYSQFGFREERAKNGIDRQRRGVSRLSACESIQGDLGRTSPVVEKTLYIDSVHKVKSHSNSSSSEMKGQTNHTLDPFETAIQDSGKCKKPSIVPRSSESLDLPFPCCLTKPLEHEIDLGKNLWVSSPKVAQCKKTLSDNSVISNQENFDGPIQNPAPWRRSRLAGDDLRSLLAAHSTDQECLKGINNGKTDPENQCQKRPDNQETNNLRLPLSLPSPKAPSESWLRRTLPTISSINVTTKIPAPLRIASNTAKHDPKWERIVKSSEELLRTIPED
ncbi:uncharacterized protein LOC114762374 isoform X2 [Neltuma alba]|uniref:uncharacterized protein LOC114762374 isoform X2 n=1 Tax=Neltuma alba TaxID=207710 RepID=UPI0010A4865F|nr:uncharacterized protein LOC114762374 isoform X2 [Prosopis alba]